MGKLQETTLETGIEDQTVLDPFNCCSCWAFRSIFSWPCMITLLLSFSLLVFAILSIPLHSKSSKHGVQALPNSSTVNILASFSLRRPLSAINSSLLKLEAELQAEVGVPDTQVRVLSLQPLRSANWTKVVFAMVPELSNVSLSFADISLLRETFVELFLGQSVKLSLSMDAFGKAYNYEVLSFPKEITVFPEQSGFPLEMVVLFNFTLSNTLSRVLHNFAQFKQQLAHGISMKTNENLFVQLTNLNGSTLKRPLIVQTSIIPVVGLLLPTSRLKQLAQEITASPKRNLGLNHTLFGRVRGLKLSSYLAHTLKSAKALSPTPAPSPSISSFCSPVPSWGFECHSCPPTQMPAPEMLPWQHRVHHHRAEAPDSCGFSVPCHHHFTSRLSSPHAAPWFQPSPASSVNPYIPAPSPIHVNNMRNFPSSAPVTQGIFPSSPQPFLSPQRGVDHSPHQFRHQFIFAKGPEPTPAVVSPVSHVHEGREAVPVSSSSSSAFVLSFPDWNLVASIIIMVILC